MKARLKPLSQQAIVITGATSGIGLTTARMAAEAGASVVLAARNGQALDALISELRRHGGSAIAVPADVGNPDEVARIGQAAMDRFGRIDTWINNAGVAIFGNMLDVPLEDHQRLFQTNFWGVVHGSLEAVRRMKGSGGALINIGSEVSDRAVPLQGMYSASKHAVKGFTDALRVELEHEGIPVSVTLIKPAGVDTLFAVHAKNYMDKEPALPPPIYAPDIVARATLYAAAHRKRDVYVGGASRLMSLAGFHMPRLLDRYMGWALYRQQKSALPNVPERGDALHAPDPAQALRERQGMDQLPWARTVHERCPYTAVALHGKGVMTALLGSGALLAAWRLTRRRVA